MQSIKENAKRREVPADTLVNNAWLCAYSSLWRNKIFSEKEITKAKELVRSYVTTAGDPRFSYLLFCQRVLLARQYLATHENSFVPLPSQWLSYENNNGFRGTKSWMEKVLTIRTSLPDYKIELKAFAEAVLEMSLEPTLSNFTYWKNYFSSCDELLNLFLNTIALQQFQNK